MRARDGKRHQIGPFWLYQRPDTGVWSICWLEPRSARNPRGAVTRRKAIDVRGGDRDNPPQSALEALAAHHLEASGPPKAKPSEALVEQLMAEWLKLHVSTLAAPRRYADSAILWGEFFAIEQRAGRLAASVTVSDMTPRLIQRFIDWRRAAGVGGHGISRDLAALRGALNWGRKNQLVETVPFIADVPPREKPRARERVLTVAEVASLIERCRGVPEREHLLCYIVIALGTAGRPDAILELRDTNIDLTRGLIDPNQPGRFHERKRRAIVPLSRFVRPWVEGEGKIVRYRAPRADRKRKPGQGPAFERETVSVRKAWTKICGEAGVHCATPKTLRHTMLTWLAYRGVPKEQRVMLAGHMPTDTTSKYEHLTPYYLAAAIAEIDAYFEALTEFTTGHLRRSSRQDAEDGQFLLDL